MAGDLLTNGQNPPPPSYRVKAKVKMAKYIYCMRAIITRRLYIFYTLFETQKRFFKEVFSENSLLMYD
jgi:hypothetical protein